MVTPRKRKSKWDQRFIKLCEKRWFPDHVFRCLLWGKQRTGKTFLPKTLFPNLEITQFNEQLTADDLMGGMGPGPDGKITWLDGPLTRAMRHGRIIQIDEFDQLSGETRYLSHQMLDNPAAVTTALGERINAAKGYGVIATTNAAPSDLPETIYDRFDIMIKADSLSDGLIKSLGTRFAGPAQAALRQRPYDDKGFTRGASPNLFMAASTLSSAGLSDEDVVEALGLDDHEAVEFLAAITTR